jgi:hypothetical protein
LVMPRWKHLPPKNQRHARKLLLLLSQYDGARFGH